MPMTHSMVDIYNREALVERLGCWPSFHDAEVQAVRLDSGQRSTGRPSIELDIHVFDVDGKLPTGRLNFLTHTIVTLRFEGVRGIELSGFGHQNVLDELEFEDMGPGWNDRTRVSLPSNNGLIGTFRCESVIVLAVEPFVPGTHSVYARPS